jgi:hypothetical protein
VLKGFAFRSQAKEFMAAHWLTTGFETLEELRAFNAEWETLGVLPEEIWPLPGRSFRFVLSGSQTTTIVQSSDDVIEFERTTGLPVRYGPDFMDWVRDECRREGTPLKQLITSLHEACHWVAGEIAGFPHTKVIAPAFACVLEKVASVLKITHVRYEPAAVAHDPDSTKRFYTEKPVEYAAMLLAPLCVMPRLMPLMAEDAGFVPDITALMRHVPGQENGAGLEAAAAFTDNPEFLERVKGCARKLRPLIRKGGITELPAIAPDQARRASAGSIDSHS